MTHTFRICLAAAATGAALTLAAPAVTPAGAAPSAQALYASSIKVAGSASVHFSSKAVESGVVLEVVGDTGASEGSQVLVIASKQAIESIEVIRFGSTGYVRGNTTALETIFGLSAAQAKANLDTWLSFPAGQKGFSSLVGVFDSDVAQDLTMSGPFSFAGKKTINGVHTIGINGTATTSSGGTVPMVLYVATGKVPRPIEQITNPKKQATSIQEVVQFSHWGEKNHTRVPAHSITLASLVGSN
jgi:hypothetical protein